MAKSPRPTLESIVTASALALIGVAGGWAAGLWDAPSAKAPPAQAEAYGPAPEADTHAGVPDVCSRRVGCLLR